LLYEPLYVLSNIKISVKNATSLLINCLPYVKQIFTHKKTVLAQTEARCIQVKELNIYVQFKLCQTERTKSVTLSLTWKNTDKETGDVVLHGLLSGRLNMT